MLFQFTTQNLKEALIQPTNLDISQTTSRWMLSGYMGVPTSNEIAGEVPAEYREV
jgi:hypothetical protein